MKSTKIDGSYLLSTRDDISGVMNSWTPQYWDGVWKRPYGRYNRHHKEIWEAMLPYATGKIIDLGVGTALMYQDTNANLTGIDWSIDALVEAKKNFPEGKYECEDITKPLPFGDKEFDTAILCGVLDYFEDWKPILTEVRRITKGEILGTLLHGFLGHDWSNPPGLIKSVGNWRVVRFA